MVRKSSSKEFKAKVAFEAMKDDKSPAELSKTYDVHPNVIRKWKELTIEALPEAFARGKSQEQKSFEAKESEYIKTIGQLTMERDFLQRAFTKIQPEAKKNGTIREWSRGAYRETPMRVALNCRAPLSIRSQRQLWSL